MKPAPAAAALPEVDVESALSALARGAGALEPAVRYVLAAPGKRIRSRMVLGWAMAGPHEVALDELTRGAAAIELFHEASLLHDDICDHGLLRRGRPSVAAAFDIRTAGLTGAFLVGRALEALASLASRRKLDFDFGGLTALSYGQILEAISTDAPTDRARYLEVAERKTGTLFRLASELGASLGGLPLGPARTFSGAFAVAFQVLDDVLDLEGGAALGKPGGTDLVQQVMTWPLIDWIESSADPAGARARLLRRAEGELEALRQEILASGATRRAREGVAFQLGRARACVDALPPSPGKSLLSSLVREVAAR